MANIQKFNNLKQLLQVYPQMPIGNAQDLTKIQPINNLIPICRVKTNKNRPFWACKCKICNQYKVVDGPRVKKKDKPGCCGNIQNLKGRKFGRLTVISLIPDKRRDRHAYWLCKCSCGNMCQVCARDLVTGDTQSCGCLVRQNSSHGEQKIIKILKENNINFKTQKQIKTNNTYKYIDFCINPDTEDMYFIEYDGKQHFLENCHFGKKETETLEIRQNRDKQKNEYCKEKNIPLIRIPYTHYNQLCLNDLLLETSEWRIV